MDFFPFLDGEVTGLDHVATEAFAGAYGCFVAIEGPTGTSCWADEEPNLSMTITQYRSSSNCYN